MCLKKLDGLDYHVRKINVARPLEVVFVCAVVFAKPVVQLVRLLQPVLQDGDLLVVGGDLLLVVVRICLAQKGHAVIVIVDLEVGIQSYKCSVAPEKPDTERVEGSDRT